jgi:hypothetical protein
LTYHSGLTLTPAVGARIRWYPSKLLGVGSGAEVMIAGLFGDVPSWRETEFWYQSRTYNGGVNGDLNGPELLVRAPIDVSLTTLGIYSICVGSQQWSLHAAGGDNVTDTDLLSEIGPFFFCLLHLLLFNTPDKNLNG